MKIKNFIYMLAVSVLTLGAVTACSDDDNWEPGPGLEPDNAGIFFAADNQTSFRWESYESKLVPLHLKRSRTEGAVTVPLTVVADGITVNAPENVTFADGEADAWVYIDFDGIPEKQIFTIRVGVPEYMTDIYGAGSAVYEGTVGIVSWETLSEVSYRYALGDSYVWGRDKGAFQIQTGSDRVRLTNFMGSGLDIQFVLYDGVSGVPAGSYQMLPAFNFLSDDTGYGEWYVYDSVNALYPEWTPDGGPTLSYYLIYGVGGGSSYSYMTIGDGEAFFSGYCGYADGSSEPWLYTYAFFDIPEDRVAEIPVKSAN